MEAVLNIKQVSSILGYSVGHIRRLVRQGSFPKPLRMGEKTKLFWLPSAILPFFQNGMGPAASE